MKMVQIWCIRLWLGLVSVQSIIMCTTAEWRSSLFLSFARQIPHVLSTCAALSTCFIEQKCQIARRSWWRTEIDLTEFVWCFTWPSLLFVWPQTPTQARPWNSRFLSWRLLSWARGVCAVDVPIGPVDHPFRSPSCWWMQSAWQSYTVSRFRQKMLSFRFRSLSRKNDRRNAYRRSSHMPTRRSNIKFHAFPLNM